MKRLAIGTILTFLVAAMITAAGCTAPGPSATTTAPASPAATTETALLFGETYVKTLDGINEVLEYVASGQEAEKTEALENFVESGIAADKFWYKFGPAQPVQQVRYDYGRLDETRTAATVSALAIIREYDAKKTVKPENIQKFEDDFEAMRAAYTKYADTYYASLPAKTLDPSTATGAAISLRKMQADLLISVSELLEHVVINEPEEMAEFDAAMARFNTQAEAFKTSPYLSARKNEVISQQYQEMMTASVAFQVAGDKLLSEYGKNKEISPQMFTAFEAATDMLRGSYDKLMASVLAKV
ncbi:MAG: hypothetical protein A4E35_00765 [Methanoregula sp. PtaU1.Bin051]|nr:MAG: hypothetical protein A4E35_00765 [Methanoregula sp. PtaU1.Bin051]